jgi:hypothetical protein
MTALVLTGVMTASTAMQAQPPARAPAARDGNGIMTVTVQWITDGGCEVI